MVRKYVRIIAIDPDVEKSGVAELHVKTRNMNITKLSFPLLVDYLQNMKEMCINNMKEDVLVIVEAGWLNHSNWHLNYSDNKRIAAAKGNALKTSPPQRLQNSRTSTGRILFPPMPREYFIAL